MLKFLLLPSGGHPAFLQANLLQNARAEGHKKNIVMQISRCWAFVLSLFPFTFWLMDCNNLWSSKLSHAKSYDRRFCNCDILACTQLQNWSQFLLEGEEEEKRTLRVIIRSTWSLSRLLSGNLFLLPLSLKSTWSILSLAQIANLWFHVSSLLKKK